MTLPGTVPRYQPEPGRTSRNAPGGYALGQQALPGRVGNDMTSILARHHPGRSRVSYGRPTTTKPQAPNAPRPGQAHPGQRAALVRARRTPHSTAQHARTTTVSGPGAPAAAPGRRRSRTPELDAAEPVCGRGHHVPGPNR